MKFIQCYIQKIFVVLFTLSLMGCYDQYNKDIQISTVPHTLYVEVSFHQNDISSLNFGNDASKMFMTITSDQNTSWIISCSSEWVTVNPKSGKGSAVITMNVNENTSNNEERNCFLTVRSTEPDYPRELNIEVTQSRDKMEIDRQGNRFVDLGLPSGTLWAEDDFYLLSDNGDQIITCCKWGDPQNLNYSKSYKWLNTSDKLTKYCTNSVYGNVDNRTELELNDDVAHYYWGGNVRTPTKEQFQELLAECDWSRMSSNIVGYVVKSKKNDKRIYLSGTHSYLDGHSISDGATRYWSRSLDTDNNNNAYILYFDENYIDPKASNSRMDALQIRPVMQR